MVTLGKHGVVLALCSYMVLAAADPQPSPQQSQWLQTVCHNLTAATGLTNPFDRKRECHYKVFMPDSQHEEMLSFDMIEPLFLWKRYITYCDKDLPPTDPLQPSLNQTLLGSTITTLGAVSTMKGPFMRYVTISAAAKIPCLYLGIGILGLGALVWMAHQCHATRNEVHRAHQQLRSQGLKRNTCDIIKVLLMEYVNATAQETERSLTKLNKQAIDIGSCQKNTSSTNQKTRQQLDNVQQTITDSSRKLDDGPSLEWVKGLLEQVMHESYLSMGFRPHVPRPQTQQLAQQGRQTSYPWNWLTPNDFDKLPQKWKSQWCHKCNNAGQIAQKICGSCHGVRLAVVHNNGKITIQKYSEHHT